MAAWHRSNHRVEPVHLEYPCGEKAFVRTCSSMIPPGIVGTEQIRYRITPYHGRNPALPRLQLWTSRLDVAREIAGRHPVSACTASHSTSPSKQTPTLPRTTLVN